MNKKYFFFDIDGTLTNKLTGELVPSAQKTIRQLQMVILCVLRLDVHTIKLKILQKYLVYITLLVMEGQL